MNHRNAFRKLGRTPSHRKALLRSLATSLIIHERIETTEAKAKELKRVADKMVTLGKKGTLHSRRQAISQLYAINKKESIGKGGESPKKLTAVHKLFEEIAPRYKDRNGGYTRVIKSRVRPGDNARMAIIEFVEEQTGNKEVSGKRRKRSVKRDVAASVADAAGEDNKTEENIEAKTEEQDQEVVSEELETEKTGAQEAQEEETKE